MSCPNKAQPGGCQLSNVHCGYPECDREPAKKPSKQGQAKQAQGYRTEPHNCGNCKFHTFEVKVPAWCERANAESKAMGVEERYLIGRYGSPRNHRCVVGGFAVQITATCNFWEKSE